MLMLLYSACSSASLARRSLIIGSACRIRSTEAPVPDPRVEYDNKAPFTSVSALSGRMLRMVTHAPMAISASRSGSGIVLRATSANITRFFLNNPSGWESGKANSAIS